MRTDAVAFHWAGGSRQWHNAQVKTRDRLLLVYFAICATFLVWPAYGAVGNRLTPYVLGLPFSFAWNIGWVLVTFVVMATYHFTGEGRE